MPSSSPEQIGFSNDGNVLVVTEKGVNLIDLYTVDHNGIASSPNSVASNGNGPYGFAVTNQGCLILSEAAGGAAVCAAGPCGTLSSYALSDGDTMRTISGSIPDFGSAPCWVAVSHNGQFAYASNAHGGTISVHSISGQGVLTLTSSLAARLSTGHSLDLAISGNGQYLYDLNGGQITAFQTYNDGGISRPRPSPESRHPRPVSHRPDFGPFASRMPLHGIGETACVVVNYLSLVANLPYHHSDPRPLGPGRSSPAPSCLVFKATLCRSWPNPSGLLSQTQAAADTLFEEPIPS
jgi:Lactonase, 7-bladed beta-propeller